MIETVIEDAGYRTLGVTANGLGLLDAALCESALDILEEFLCVGL